MSFRKTAEEKDYLLGSNVARGLIISLRFS